MEKKKIKQVKRCGIIICTRISVIELFFQLNVSNHATNESWVKSVSRKIYVIVVVGTADTFRTLFRRRDFSMRLVLFVDIALYVCHSFAIVDGNLTYLYMVK